MPVKKRARRIHNWLLLIVALHQHCIKSCNAPFAKSPRALHQARHATEHRWRISFGRRRLTRCQPDLTRSHGKPRQGIQHQKHMLALMRKIFSNSCRRKRGPQPQQRRLVRSRHHHNRTLPPFRPEALFEKFSDLAPTFSHQPNNDHVLFAVPRHHADQRALAHARSAEYPNTLAAPYCQHSINRANPRPQRLTDRHTLQGIWNSAIKWNGHASCRPGTIINRLACCIQHSTDQPIPGFQIRQCTQRRYFISKANALRAFKRHRKHVVAAEANHFRQMRLAIPIQNLATLARRTQRARRFNRLPHSLNHASLPAPGLALFEARKVCGQQLHSFRLLPALRLLWLRPAVPDPCVPEDRRSLAQSPSTAPSLPDRQRQDASPANIPRPRARHPQQAVGAKEGMASDESFPSIAAAAMQECAA